MTTITIENRFEKLNRTKFKNLEDYKCILSSQEFSGFTASKVRGFTTKHPTRHSKIKRKKAFKNR